MKILEHKIEDRVLNLLTLMADLGLDLETPEIKFNITGRDAGYCAFTRRGKKYVLGFNLEFMSKYEENFLKYTVSHEVAHYVVSVLYGRNGVKPHGEQWKRVMHVFGVKKPLRCHGYCKNEPTKKKPWVYRCKCQGNHYMSNLIHNRIREGAHYYCNKCKGLLEFVRRG